MELNLYYFDTCPFCRKVLDYIDEADLRSEIVFKNTGNDPANREELISIGGKSMVPCLVIDGKALYESLDIIEFLKSNFKG